MTPFLCVSTTNPQMSDPELSFRSLFIHLHTQFLLMFQNTLLEFLNCTHISKWKNTNVNVWCFSEMKITVTINIPVFYNCILLLPYLKLLIRVSKGNKTRELELSLRRYYPKEKINKVISYKGTFTINYLISLKKCWTGTKYEIL